MKSLFVIGLVGFVGGLSISKSPLNSDPCLNSPCGVGAKCETLGALTICKCPDSHTGDPFVRCFPASETTTSHSPMPSSTFTMETSGYEKPSQNRVSSQSSHSSTTFQKEVVVSSTVPNSEMDFSRVPIRGSSSNQGTTQSHHLHLSQNSRPRPVSHDIPLNTNTGPTQFKLDSEHYYPSRENIPMMNGHTHHSISSNTPISHHLNIPKRHQISSPQHFSHSFTSTKDPMGKYSNCRSINGVVVCADDNSVNDMSDSSSRVHGQDYNMKFGESENWMQSETFQSVPKDLTNSNYYPLQTDSIGNTRTDQVLNLNGPIRHTNGHMNNNNNNLNNGPISSKDPLCKSMCGVNSICRLVFNRPVCGCPENTTGDPSVRCDPIETKEEECKRHTECSQHQICIKTKCMDPCGDVVNGSSSYGSGIMCGSNAKCMVIQHTPLCGCEEGFYGNPYVACTA